jgi:predicted amidophosphoribosyltransferase
LCFNGLVIFHKSGWDYGFGDPNRENFNSRRIFLRAFRECCCKLLVKSVKFINEYLLQGVFTAELVDLVVDLIENPYLIVFSPVLLDRLKSKLFLQLVDYLNPVKHDLHTT